MKERRREQDDGYTRVKEVRRRGKKERHTDRKREENQRMEGKTPTHLGEPGIINKIQLLERLTTHRMNCELRSGLAN